MSVIDNCSYNMFGALGMISNKITLALNSCNTIYYNPGALTNKQRIAIKKIRPKIKKLEKYHSDIMTECLDIAKKGGLKTD